MEALWEGKQEPRFSKALQAASFVWVGVKSKEHKPLGVVAGAKRSSAWCLAGTGAAGSAWRVYMNLFFRVRVSLTADVQACRRTSSA